MLQVMVGGAECRIQEVKDESITCVAPAQAMTTSPFPGISPEGRGHDCFQPVGLRYTYNIMFSPRERCFFVEKMTLQT